MRHGWMKRTAVSAVGMLVLYVGFSVEVVHAQTYDTTISSGETPVLKTQIDKQSYAIGVETGRNFKRQGFDVDLVIVIKGMKDAVKGHKLLMTDEELLSALNIFASQLRVKQPNAKLIAAQDNKKEGEEFLAANKLKDGVVTLPSGLQYKILRAGEGKKPTDNDTVECNWVGTLINGTEFENTYKTGESVTFKLNNMSIIKGLRDALKLMPVGSKWQLFIPSNLAYLQHGAGRYIGPNATLIYEIELLSIK
jgi:FKBP-type peptidyl-prolyl cis-trans isomerase